MRTSGMAVVVCFCLITAAWAADWEQWRGPTRNGVATDPTELLDAFPAGGLKPLWASEKILADQKGGFGSVAVADGKVYVYANPRHPIPLETRTLAAAGLRALGWVKGIPEDLVAKVEEARISEERAGLKRAEIRKWLGAWVRKNVPKEQEKFSRVCALRLARGKAGVPAEDCKRLEEIVDREFPDAAAFEKWLDENTIGEAARKAVLRVVPTTVDTAKDKVFCLDAETGKRVWLRELPGVPSTWQSSSTPCVVDGKCYVAGSGGKMYCLDAGTGEVVWEGEFEGGKGKDVASSFAVVDGCAMLVGGNLLGLDAKTGEELWRNTDVRGIHSSVAIWVYNGLRDDRKFAVVCSGKETICVDPTTGKTLWKVPGGGASTPAIVGDNMVVLAADKNTGLVAYKLNLIKPKKLWSVPGADRGASPVIYDNYVYSVGNKSQIVCVELATGKVAWLQKEKTGEYSSPILADGKLLHVLGKGFCMIEASPDGYKLLGKSPIPTVRCTSPALVDGRVYLRMKDGVACFDLRKPKTEGVE